MITLIEYNCKPLAVSNRQYVILCQAIRSFPKMACTYEEGAVGYRGLIFSKRDLSLLACSKLLSV